MGVGAALTVPSAMHMIVHLFPEPTAQSKAIGGFSTSGALGNMLGLVIGALLTSFASWPWVFYFMSILGILESIAVFFLCPPIARPKSSALEKAKRFRRLDVFGVSLVTVSLILFIFGVTSGASMGWGQAKVIAPLAISVVAMAVFFVYEAYLPEYLAAVPPKTWKYQNFGILIATALLPYMCLPLSLVGIPGTVLVTILQQKFPLKWVMFVGECITIAGTILLPFSNSKQRYWRLAFPGTLIGSFGVLVTFVTSKILNIDTVKSVAIFATTPPEAAGVVAAIFNSSLQVGCAAGIAIVTSIQTSIQITHGGPLSFVGRADGFWFLFAAVCVLTVALLLFMKDTIPPLGMKLHSQVNIAVDSNEKEAAGPLDNDEEAGDTHGEL
ncbi:Major facilitator superfamily multidrug transporter mfsC [Psilocybe cubensis]|uniref:Major facilitator superfamily multidrug transporter mfsC n=1 Tax=Psilocybe cubensis TaxID=181762 RepID=A0ACB8GKB8_PSICU|nr:Major facilitator superfamily multidrug transporter mfsC [Psilocybe cubensis]KAH9475978.1 Major facilitator superfamily multidrug transporter mfsC [Psilocybe cubensis]